MSPEQEVLQEMLAAVPLNQKLAHLVLSCLVSDAAASVENVAEICVIMAKYVPPEKRAAVIWALRDAANDLSARWQ
jgi:hypothetical protein